MYDSEENLQQSRNDHRLRSRIEMMIHKHRQSNRNIRSEGIYALEIVCDQKTIHYTIDLNLGKITPGRSNDVIVDCFFRMTDETLMQILDGREDFAKVYLKGKLQIKGKSVFAFKFQQFLMDALKLSQEMNDDIYIPILKSDIIFEMMKTRISFETRMVEKVPFIIQIDLLQGTQKPSNRDPIVTWTLDTKYPGGRIYRSKPLDDIKPDAKIIINDDDLVTILLGKMNPQKLFLLGKLKIQGNILLLQRLNRYWNSIQNDYRSPEFDLIKEIILNNELKSDFASEVIFFELLQRLFRLLPDEMLRDSTIRFIITDSKGIEQIEWALLFDQNGRIRSVTHRISKDSRLVITEIMQPHLDIKLSDRDFIKLIRQNYSNQFREAIDSGRIHITGKLPLISIIDRWFHRRETSQFLAKL
ncbi:A disintegrin and metalloproteinase with thrombospondin motifs 18 [Sarcoptes scabiei]|nr:A disintegrin and metalloproteinase with thrombospondin motifs 18 [Sarcoptes scabiei]